MNPMNPMNKCIFFSVIVFAHVLILPWGLVGIASYYPVKYSISKEKTYDDVKSGFTQLAEFEEAYLLGPLSAPVYLIKKGLVACQKKHARHKHLSEQKSLARTVRDITSDVLSISRTYEDPLMLSAAEQLGQDLLHIARNDGDRIYSSSSLAAIDVLESCVDKTYRRHKSRLQWRIAQSKHIIEKHRFR